MSKTCVRAELPKRYNESERKAGRSKLALYLEEEDNWIFITDILK